MPKMKTHRGAAKRFIVTKSGRLKYKHAHLRHNLSSKSKDRKRELGKRGYIDDTDHERVVRMLHGE